MDVVLDTSPLRLRAQLESDCAAETTETGALIYNYHVTRIRTD